MSKYLILLPILLIGCGDANGGDFDTDPGTHPCTIVVNGDHLSVDCSVPVACQSDRACDEGTFCLNGHCASACTTDEDCSGEATCNVRGRCVPPYDPGTGGSGGTATCQDVDITPIRVVPNVMFLVDQSGTMRYDFGGEPRWDAAHRAVTDVVALTNTIVNFGLVSYTSDEGFSGGTCPVFPTTLDLTLNNEEILDEALFSSTYDGSYGKDTPTAESLSALTTSLAENPESLRDGPTIIVLATDGLPDTCEEPNRHNELARQMTVDAATAAFDEGFQTYILSVGPEVTDDHLREVAEAGTGDPNKFWKAFDSEELSTAFVDIVTDSIPCDITMDESFADTEKACAEGTVYLGNTQLFCEDDWRVKDGTNDVIELVGEACDIYKLGEYEFSASFPCGIVIVE